MDASLVEDTDLELLAPEPTSVNGTEAPSRSPVRPSVVVGIVLLLGLAVVGAARVSKGATVSPVYIAALDTTSLDEELAYPTPLPPSSTAPAAAPAPFQTSEAVELTDDTSPAPAPNAAGRSPLTGTVTPPTPPPTPASTPPPTPPPTTPPTPPPTPLPTPPPTLPPTPQSAPLETDDVAGDDAPQDGSLLEHMNTRHHPIAKTARTATPKVDAEGILLDGDPLTKHEDMNDGNLCDNTEELYGNLCYRSCKNFTKGEFPYRKTAFSCCKTKACPLKDMIHMKSTSLVPCQGFDRSAEDAGNSCPHSAGICLEDEETWVNKCYKSCHALTHGVYPHRVAPLTCCKQRGVLCLNPFMDWTNIKFNVGGGDGYGKPHYPDTHLTELPSSE